MDAVITLVQPIADAIHQLEADSPLLSKVKPVWDAILKHVESWAKLPTVSQSLARDVVKTAKARYKKHYVVEWLAAYLLDPSNAVETGNREKGKLPLPLLLH